MIQFTRLIDPVLFSFRVSERQISVYSADDVTSPLGTVGLDVSPAILIPFYDEDSSTLFVTGKVSLRCFTYVIRFKKFLKIMYY